MYFIQSKCKFSDFQLLALKLTKFLMSFFKPQVSFRLNFATRFSVIPLKFSNWNSVCFRQKECINVQFFRLLGAVMKVHLILHAIFETTRSGFIQILHHCSVSWKITPLYFFSSNLIYSYTLDKNSSSQWNLRTFDRLGENSQNWNYK